MSKIKNWFSEQGKKVTEALNEQPWFQELKSKWDALDSQVKTYTLYGATAFFSLLLCIFVLSAMIQSGETRGELNNKLELLSYIRKSQAEIRGLRGRGSAAGGNSQENLSNYLKSLAGRSGIKNELVQVSADGAGKDGELSEESLFKMELTKVNVKQVTKLAYTLETSNSPLKVRHLDIQTVGPDGYLKASIAVSGFKLKEQK